MPNNQSSFVCKELLTRSLAPRISVISSTSANTLVSTYYNVSSFYHFLRPFERLESSFSIKNTQLITTTYKEFDIRFCESVIDVLQKQKQEETKNEIRGLNKYDLFRLGELDSVMADYVKGVDSEINKSVSNSDKDSGDIIKILKSSIYSKLVTKLYSNGFILPFETFNHPIIHLIVLTSEDSVEFIGEILQKNQLTRKRHLMSPDPKSTVTSSDRNVPGYLDLSSDDDSLICFLVLVQSVDGDSEKCEKIMSYVKKNYYYPCLSLKLEKTSAEDDKLAIFPSPTFSKSVEEEFTELNEPPPSPPKSLSESQVNLIQIMLIELIKLNLIPFMEKKISYWDDVHIQPRKSIANRFMSVSRKYFATTSKSHEVLYDDKTGYYHHASSEAVTRKLADWSFMLKDYKYASQTYDLLKKDFNNEKSWSYLASCQQMSVISSLFNLIHSSLSPSFPPPDLKARLTSIGQMIDVVNYTYSSRCNLKSFVLRFQITVSELFNCLRFNTFADSSSVMSTLSTSASYNIYPLKYLYEIISWKLLESSPPSKSVVRSLKSKVVPEPKSYYLLKALVMERISYTFSVFLFNHSKYNVLLKNHLISNPNDITTNVYGPATVSQSEIPFSVFKKNEAQEDIPPFNPYKLKHSNLALMGMTRYRKAGFWLLLSTNQWDHLNDMAQMKLNLDNCLEMVYGLEDNDHLWLKRAEGLIAKFSQRCKDELNIYDEGNDDESKQPTEPAEEVKLR